MKVRTDNKFGQTLPQHGVMLIAGVAQGQQLPPILPGLRAAQQARLLRESNYNPLAGLTTQKTRSDPVSVCGRVRSPPEFKPQEQSIELNFE